MSDITFLIVFTITAILLFIMLSKTNKAWSAFLISFFGATIVGMVIWGLFSFITIGEFGVPSFITKINFLKLLESLTGWF